MRVEKGEVCFGTEPEIDFRIVGTSTYANCLNILPRTDKGNLRNMLSNKLDQGSKIFMPSIRGEA